MKIKKWGWAVMLMAAGVLRAEDPRWEAMERRLSNLDSEVTQLKDKNSSTVYTPVYGLAPSASKVFHLKEGVSLGGYGEMTFQGYDKQTDGGDPSKKRNQWDLYRFVLYAGYRWTDRFVMNSEIEFEHAAEDKRGEISVEMATLDYLWRAPLNARVGLVLLPVGFLNEYHEPGVYHGVNRPSVERNIIPSTWRENGAGLFGQAGPISYRAYVVNGFQAVSDYAVTGSSGNVKGYSASSGLRDGRQKGSNAFAEDLAWVGRMDYSVLPGVSVGGSYYTGRAGQGAMVSGQELSARTSLWETHGDVQWKGFEIRGLYSRTSVSQADLVNMAQGFAGTKSVGERMWGGYGQWAYNVLAAHSSGLYLAPFMRYERYNTQWHVPAGFASDPANDRTEWVYGLTFRPISTLALKGEYQNNRNRADKGVDQWNFGAGFMF